MNLLLFYNDREEQDLHFDPFLNKFISQFSKKKILAPFFEPTLVNVRLATEFYDLFT